MSEEIQKICSVNGCCRTLKAKGYCSKHYQRFRHGVDVNAPDRNDWSKEEIQFLKDNYDFGCKYVAEKLGRTSVAVCSKAKKIGLKSNRFFSESEIDYVERHSDCTNKKLAKVLGKTESQIKTLRYRESFGTVIDSNYDKLTCAECGRLIGKHKTYFVKVINNNKIKGYKRGKYKMIKTDDLLVWMQNNPNKWDATKCDKFYFMEYEWFRSKREKDFQSLIQKKWGKEAI